MKSRTPTLKAIPSLEDQVAPAEWQARVDLAALYRLVALRGWDDMIYTHISARIPGTDGEFLINPYGLFFEEITASSLVRIDHDGCILQDTNYPVNRAGFMIHSAIHAAREDAHFVMHLHTDTGIAVACQKQGLMPLSQHALMVLPHLAYHGYEGIALHEAERDRLAADLGGKTLMLLRNHGTLAVGDTAANCWSGMHYLERACAVQIQALSAGHAEVLIAPAESQEEVRRQVTGRNLIGGRHSWAACLRKLDRALPGYDK
ncbi:aldolase [Sphingomonas sp. Leaf357]|uniref:class II aldolase/adducin family protein n=1 Tax=Sphingomonas sp. Leaf357 TaxID=1736350 RepID=UPI0007011C77|nr:class II aldolase/adducin family protein [Sphingomonas sp. Leaf357]KQS05168.1 aldolase [Sphingomonas sp. Leaf357]